ncbi:hypothetical protein D3C78_298140 [compost metagenome]
MSSVARWSYTSTATVYPRASLDAFTGVETFGEAYTIACTWIEGGGMVLRDDEGDEFVAKTQVWCEDARPQVGDEIEMDGGQRERIKGRKRFDMSPFGEPDSPDFELVTGAFVR